MPQNSENADDDDDVHDYSLLSSLSASSPRIMSQSGHHLLKMMDDLKLNAADATPSVMENISHHLRKTSSSYPSQDGGSTRVQSPDSMLHANRLSLTNLSRFSKANHRLSNLRSTLSDDGHDVSMSTCPPEAVEEASNAIAQWQDELPPKAKPAESAEVLPCDSASQQLPHPTPRSAKDAGGVTWESHDLLKGQYDGIHEPNNRFESPDPALRPRTPASQENPHRRSKRKASVFSLRSLTNSLSKRPRFGLRKWASSMYQQTSQRLSLARLKWRQQARRDRRAFEAWRDRHRSRTSQEASPYKGRSDGHGVLSSSERHECANEDWWRDGVSRYEAPKWMNFRTGVSHSHG